MIALQDLLSSAHDKGVKFWVKDAQLHFRGPAGALSPDDRAAIRERRDEIMEFLQRTVSMSLDAPPPLEARKGVEEEIPVSFAQERLIFLDQLGVGGSAYNIPLTCRLEGQLDVAALRGALSEVIRRHEGLRTRFELKSGRAVQRIEAQARFELPLIELDGQLDGAGRAEQLRREHMQWKFDLQKGPLICG